MCGICGQVRGVGGAEPGAIHRMVDALAHRGPDDRGVYTRGAGGLGHARLSIIDLSRGHQPVANETNDIWVILNGEIYNYQSLREDLIARGHRMRTESDTEVIVHLYEEYGARCVNHLRGMFSFAIWDEREQKLFAARDRLGQKPFYYAQRNGELIFASEIKALLAYDPGLAELDAEALDQYLALRIIMPPHSMFRRIRKLPPAHTLEFRATGGLRIERYWDLSYEPKLKGSDEELADQLEEKIVEALRLHMVSDVPVGAFLSGGLDSTLVVALLAKYVAGEPLQTFSGSLGYGDYDEAPYARMVAERYGTKHHEESIQPSLVGLLPQIVAQMDEPSDSLCVCSYLIARLARQHVKVALGGDGGDELFGGYDRYYGNRFAGIYAMLPASVRRVIGRSILDRIPGGGWYKSVGHQLKWLHHLSFLEGGHRYGASLGYFYFGRDQRASLYTSELRDRMREWQPAAPIVEAYEGANAEHPIDRMLCADMKLRMPDHSVMILDRMTMAHGLEARSPFLDHELAEFSARLPVHLKVRGRSLRRIQTMLAQRHLPREVLERPKQGFSVALPYMLRDEYKVLFSAFLVDSQLARDGVWQQAALDRFLSEHNGRRADHGNRLWLLLNAEVWYRMFLRGATSEDLSAEIQAGVERQSRASR